MQFDQLHRRKLITLLGGATGFYCPGGYLARRVTQLGDAIASRGGRRQAALFGLSRRRLYRDVDDDRGQQSAGGQEVEPGLEASRAVLDPTDDERPDVAAEIADRVDEGDSTRGGRPVRSLKFGSGCPSGLRRLAA